MNDIIPQFSYVLGRFVHRSAYSVNQLSKLSGVPNRTIANWLEGRVRKPRRPEELLKIAASLHLNEGEVSELLQTAGFRSIEELLSHSGEIQQTELLTPWADAVRLRTAHAPFQVIADLPYFVGREDILHTLTQNLLHQRQVMICSLQGMGGVGKTSLAAHLAYQLRSHFPDGVLWANVERSDTMAILNSFATAYKYDVSQYKDLDTRSQIVRDILAHRRVLVILDNVPNSKTVRPLLPPTTGNCALIITTRRHDLDVTFGMHRYSLGPFNREKEESLALFAKVLGKKRARNEKESLAEIADLLGQLPLAVSVAANRLAYEPDWQTSDLLHRLRHEEKRLSLLVSENQSIQLSFNLSYQTLLPEQQDFFAALSVFGGEDFSAEAVAYVTEQSLTVAHDRLRELYGLSLVQLSQPGRYRLHPLLHDYARAQLKDLSAWERMVDYFIHYIALHKNDYDGLDLENSNIQAALQTAFARGFEATLVKGVNAFFQFLEVRGLFNLAETYLGRAKQIAQTIGDRAGLAMTIFHLGRLAQQMGRQEQATQYLQEGLTLAHERPDIQAVGHRLLGWVLWQQGQYEAARLQLEQALALAQDTASLQVEADSLNNLGITYWYLGDYAKARGYFEQSLPIYHEISDLRSQCGVLLNLGSGAVSQGTYVKARDYFERSLSICRRLGFRQIEGSILNSLGSLSLLQGQHTQAKNRFEEALQIAQEIGARRDESEALHHLGVTIFEQGDFIKAKTYFEESLRAKRETSNRLGEGATLLRMALVYHYLGDYTSGHTFYEQALSIFRQLRFQSGKGQALTNWGLLFYHIGDNEIALEYGQQALAIAQELGDRHAQGNALTLYGRVLTAIGSLSEAEMAYREVLRLREVLGQPHLAMEALAGLAHLYLLREELAEALTFVEQILSYLDEAKSLTGTREPFWIYLICYHVLFANSDSRYQPVLTIAYHQLYEQADKIGDEQLQHSFLENVPVHKEIVKQFTQIC